MQNKILIIGNGFDLYHKLPTRYTDFLFFAKHWKEFKDEYDKKHDSVVGQEFASVDIRLGDRNELTSASLADFATYGELYSEEHIAYLNSNLQSNTWLAYFDKTQFPGQNWIDFEAEIQKALVLVERYHNQILPSVNNDVPFKGMSPELVKVIYTFSDKLEKINDRYKNLAKNIFRCNNGTDLEKIHPNKLMLLEFMKNELDILNHCLNLYLLDFVSIIKCDEYSEQIKELGKVHLLNFNYTHTYEMVYGTQALKEQHFIHGDARSENLVLGIQDEVFQDNIDYVYFQKYFQRIQKRTGNYYKKWAQKPVYSALEDLPAQVFIMGHSLSKVDGGALKDLFFERNVEQIKIFYHNQLGYESQVVNLIEMFGKDFIIEQTGNERIIFEELKSPVALQ